jgi:flagellar export protein FliJ
MASHFPLQAVLHFRQSIEHQHELRLRAANQQVARARHILDQLDARLLQLHTRWSQDVAAGTSGAELRFALSCEATLRQQRQVVQNELLRLQNLRDEQQRIFQQARRDRETFESLRDYQLREYRREAARREQRQLDDLFLLRQAYLRRG